jgi:hypothetical protein
LLLYNSVGTFWYILQQALFLRAKNQKISIGALFRGKILKFPHAQKTDICPSAFYNAITISIVKYL